MRSKRKRINKRWAFLWGQEVGPKPSYLKRWILETPWFSLRLHKWRGSDDPRAFHDHAWDFATIVLKGSYLDVNPEGIDRLTAGSFRFRRAKHRHTVKILQNPTWTFVVTGPVKREFGFWVKGKFRHRNKYFYEYGHH